MRLRQHRGMYDESMKTVVEIEPTKQAIHTAISKNLMGVSEKDIHVNPYCRDSRDGWINTHIVIVDGYGVYGFTDEQLIG